MKRVVVPLATGFEEIEAVAVIDILRRADVEVRVAGVGGARIVGGHGLAVECDCLIEDCDADGTDAVVLPGGMPGTLNLGKSEAVRRLINGVAAAGRVVAAICAAPTVLCSAGLLDGKTATSHPAHEHEMTGCNYSRDRVVVDGNLVTSRGAGTAVEFAIRMAGILAGPEKARELESKIVYR
jgi:4-methyl-5(b-hydroxyethyl)-thiazole monophosphate biosynthesis